MTPAPRQLRYLGDALRRRAEETGFQLASWPVGAWAAVGVAALLAALVMGVPTGLIPSPVFRRMGDAHLCYGGRLPGLQQAGGCCLGVSGALEYFAPIQPLLGVISLALLSVGLLARLRSQSACAIVPPSRSDRRR